MRISQSERSGGRFLIFKISSYAWQGVPQVQIFHLGLCAAIAIGLVWPQRRGQSTLLKLLLGDLKMPQQGQIKVGTKLKWRISINRGICSMMKNPLLTTSPTAKDQGRSEQPNSPYHWLFG